ncbi:MAG: hypothetical protein HUU18_12310 [Phycisphaerales bacterium]|nr:hypothetical protein [Phycisphaerales bacterium]
MAKTSTAPAGGKGGMDQKQMIKAGVAVAAILATGLWLLYYTGVIGGGEEAPPPPSDNSHLSDADKKAQEELMRRKQEMDLKRPPAGS